MIGVIPDSNRLVFHKYIHRKSKGGISCFFDKIEDSELQPFYENQKIFRNEIK